MNFREPVVLRGDSASLMEFVNHPEVDQTAASTLPRPGSTRVWMRTRMRSHWASLGLATCALVVAACSGSSEASAPPDGHMTERPDGPSTSGDENDDLVEPSPDDSDGEPTPEDPDGDDLEGPGPGDDDEPLGPNADDEPEPDPTNYPDDPSVDPIPFEPSSAITSVRKVKQLLIGLPPTDEEVLAVTESGASALQTLIADWTTASETLPLFKAKMVPFFRNMFQQVGFTPTEDFKLQLLENGGFDFGPLGERAVGGEVYFRLVQNVQDSFALTAWQLVEEGRSFAEVLTTRDFMMTTALKSLYLQIETPNDEPFNFGFGFGQDAPERLEWWIDYSGEPIPLSESLDPGSPNYLVFSDEPPADGGGFDIQFGRLGNCRGTTEAPNDECVASGASFRCRPSGGYSQLFQRLIGYTPRYPFAANPDCGEHASEPVFSIEDTEDWQWVSLQNLEVQQTLQPYDVPALREATSMSLALPRVGFFTTPAFLALWNTNDSNQHRVTANQTLLVALHLTFTPEDAALQIDPVGLDVEHSVAGTQCFGCHQTLDPLREFWESYYDFNDRNDFPTSVFGGVGTSNPRPDSPSGGFAIFNVQEVGTTMDDLGVMLARVVDDSVPDNPVNRFAVATTQALCFYANSVECSTKDPEFRRVAAAFETSGFDFATLVRELFSSPLVTGASMTQTAEEVGLPVSVARRDHVCAALSHRLGLQDVCYLSVPRPSSEQGATLDVALSIAGDAFSRGAESPVTPAKPTLFYRAATELLCEDVAERVVDAESGGLYSSDDSDGAIADMVERLLGYPPSDPHHADALAILQSYHAAALEESSGGGGNPFGGQPFGGGSVGTNALRSTFSLACQSPTNLAVGL